MEESVVFCATGISDSQPLPEVKFVGNTSSTSTILMRARSQTVRYILAAHILSSNTTHLRSVKRDANWIARAIIPRSIPPFVARISVRLTCRLRAPLR